MKNVLFIIRTLAHLSYHASTLRALSKKGSRIILLHDEIWSGRTGWSQQYLDELLLDKNVCIEVHNSIRRDDNWRNILFAVREISTYASYLARKDTTDFYKRRWEKYIHPFARILFGGMSPLRHILASKSVCMLLRFFEKLAPASVAIKEQINSFAPHVVVASPVNMRFSEEVEYIKAAKSLGIPTVVPVLSWDNLTTKGLFHVQPDMMLVWNQAQFREARIVHGLPDKSLCITGSPFLDKWYNASGLRLERKIFCERMGLDTERAYLLYLGSSANIAKDESWIVSSIAEALKNSNDSRLRSLQILVRPHGANQKVFNSLEGENIRTWLRDEQLPETRDDLMEFVTSMYEAVCAVGLNTTGMLDAVMAGRPVITMMVPEYSNKNTAKAVHFQYILDADIYERAMSPASCLELVSHLLDGRDDHASMRDRFINEFVWTAGRDKPAGEVQAEAIFNAMEQKSNQ